MKIPKDKQLDTKALGELFVEAQNSYKHLLFSFLLQELPRRTATNLLFSPAELQVGMLKIAEFPAMKCHLSLGQDAHLLNGFVQGVPVPGVAWHGVHAHHQTLFERGGHRPQYISEVLLWTLSCLAGLV